MPQFDPTGDLISDLQASIDFSQSVQLDYVDGEGQFSTRAIAPLEVRGDRFYAWDLEKWDLRLFLLTRVQAFFVLEDTFDRDSF